MTKHKKIRTPGGRTAIHFKARKTSAPRCPNCGSVLHGIGRMSVSQLAGAPSSQKKVSRMYGGNLCHSCGRELLKVKARNI